VVALLSAGCESNVARPARVDSQPPLSLKEGKGTGSATASGPSNSLYAELERRLRQGHFEEVYERAGLASRSAADDLQAFKFRLLQAKAAARKNEAKEALRILAPHPPPGASSEDIVRGVIISADATCRLGKHSDGVRSLVRIKPLLPAVSADHVLNAEWSLQRAKCEPAMKSQTAANYLKQARQMAHGYDAYLEASAVGNLGWRLHDSNRFDQAIDHFNTVLQLEREIDSPLLREVTFANICKSFFELGDYEKASYYAMLSERLASDLGHVEDQVRRLIDLGANEKLRGNRSKAAEYYLRSLALARKDYDKTDPGARARRDDIMVRIYNNLTVIELDKLNWDGAEDYSRQAATLHPIGEPLIRWKFNQIDIALGRKNFSKARAGLAEFLSSSSQNYKSLWFAQERMARMYEAMGKPADAEIWYRETIKTGIKAAAVLTHGEYKTALLGNLPFFGNYIDYLVRHNRNDEALQIAEIGRTRALAKELPLDLPAADTTSWIAGIRERLRRSNKVVLAYWLSESTIYTWLVTPRQVHFTKQSYSSQDLNRLVDGYQYEIMHPRKPEESTNAAKLYEVLIEPMKEHLPKASKIIIIPHGSLYEINFESLVMPAPPHYLIEEFEVENAISLNQTISSNQQRSYPKDILALGAAIQVTEEFPPLQGAKEEIQQVTDYFRADRKEVFMAERATPQAFLTSKLDQRYIHFAGHSTRSALEPLDSAVILSPDAGNSYKLYARDIANLKRPIHAEIVTISSCDSAGIRTNSMSPIGLMWAFLHAGAHHVVAASWKVDDTAAPELMGHFYRELVGGKMPSEALRDAKLTMLHSHKTHRLPYYWATLQLYSGS